MTEIIIKVHIHLESMQNMSTRLRSKVTASFAWAAPMRYVAEGKHNTCIYPINKKAWCLWWSTAQCRHL